MNTEWIIEAKCPQKEGSTLEQTARTCTECSYKIWNHPISALGSNSAMCSITLGKLVDELDSIAYKIDAIKEFTAQNLSSTERIRTLERIKEYAKKKRWRFAGLSPNQTIDRLNTFIEFCQRAEAKGFNILQRR